MTRDTVESVFGRGQIEWDRDGHLRFRGAAHDLFVWLDSSLERLALEAGARPQPAPEEIEGDTLQRSGYFESFPGVGIPAGAGDVGHVVNTLWVPPAVCYHAYPSFAGERLRTSERLTLACGCGRNEATSPENPGRLRRFRMREVVFLGAPAWVAAERDAWMARGHAFAASIGLDSTLEPATDLFFGAAGRGQQLIQKLKALKFELRTDAGPAGIVAAASFNLHESFFARRFDIRLDDGSMAATGCAAFGVERWTLACLAQLGAERAAELVRTR